MTKKQIEKHVNLMPLDELRWAAMMYSGEPTEGELTVEQKTILELAYKRALSIKNLWG